VFHLASNHSREAVKRYFDLEERSKPIVEKLEILYKVPPFQ